jgi:hypothetical protein
VRIAVQLSPTARDDLACESLGKERARNEQEDEDDEETVGRHCQADQSGENDHIFPE